MTASPQEISETAVITANSSLRQEIVPQLITQAFQRLHHRPLQSLERFPPCSEDLIRNLLLKELCYVLPNKSYKKQHVTARLSCE